LKPLLIVFSVLIFAGIFALSWNQWLRPVEDVVANGDTSGSGPVSQSTETGPGPAATPDTGSTGDAPAQPAEPAATAQSRAAAEGGAEGAGVKADEVAALTPQTGTDSAQSAAPQGETGAAANAPDAPGTAAQPSFDIVRVEPSGDTVVAGRSAPGAVIELLSNGSVIATTTADAAGEFVLVLETPLAAGGHDLALRTSGGEGVSIYSKTNVAVAVPEKPSGEVLVVMNEPGAASEILEKPDEAASAETGTEVAATGETVIAVAPSADPGRPETSPQVAEPVETAPVAPVKPAEATDPAPAVPLAPQPQMAEATPAVPETAPQPKMAKTASGEIPAGNTDQVADAGQTAAAVASAAPVPLGVEAVEVEGGKLYAAGTAKPGEIIRVYIDGEPAGETTAFDNGRWLVETEANVPAGTVIVRADQLAPGRSKVVARAEVPFTRQLEMAVLIPVAKSGAAAGAVAKGELPKPNSVIIRRGDNLWTISRRTYGRGIRYTTIYTANKNQIRNPHRIYPGQVFMLPVGDKAWTR
jgi:nucleoid-associated protein YgaU